MECEFFVKFSKNWKFQTVAINRIRFNPVNPVNPVKRFD